MITPLRSVAFVVLGSYVTSPADPLRVMRAAPTNEAEAGAVITVIFDRPIAAGLDATVDPGTIFRIAPRVAGKLEWRDPVTIRFTPSRPLTFGTSYTVTIANTFEAMDGSRLEQPYAFSFRVHGPRVDDAWPVNRWSEPKHLTPTQRFLLLLDGPADPKSVESLVEIKDTEAPVTRGPGVAAAASQFRDTAATGIVHPEGGKVELPGFASVRFPAGAFAAPQAVTVEATSLPEWRAIFDVLASVYESAPPLSYEIRVTTGQVRAATDFEVAVVVPDAYFNALPSGHAVEVFALVVNRGPDERIERFKPYPSTFDPMTKTVRAQLPQRTFDDDQRVAGVFEAVVMVGSGPR